MYQFLRKVKKMLMRIRAYFLFPFVLIDYLKFKKNDHSKRFKISLKEVLPVLFENIPFTRFDTHYIYHTAWAARKVKEIGATYHTDISSSLYFSSIVSAFTPVHFYDYRPASLNLSGLTSGSANLSNLHFEDNSINSLSCMHTVEHIGLGRYGDPIDPDGDIQAAMVYFGQSKKITFLFFFRSRRFGNMKKNVTFLLVTAFHEKLMEVQDVMHKSEGFYFTLTLT
jgi:hypothetical protein